MRIQYVLLPIVVAILVSSAGAARIRPAVGAVNNALYQRFVCARKADGFRTLQPGSCSQFYECQAGVAKAKSCRNFFDPKSQKCVSYNVGCVEVKQATNMYAEVEATTCETTTLPCEETTTTCVPTTTTTCEATTTTTCEPTTTTTCETTTTTCEPTTTTTCEPTTTTTCESTTTTTCEPSTTTTTTTASTTTTTTT
ncbi:integumentary mucin C.1-like isoform X3 [Drosophila sulfurigaster albostrigata]|nr:integumentary mucin C.1-like isoform X3 [Drosophila sulfurigaster albostrigata]